MGQATSDIPARLDRLDWSKFHTRLVIALGVAWILDGLEITIASNVSNIISKPAALGLGSGSVAFSVGTIYLLGEVFGALFFGRLSDKWGRKNLFMITLGVYLLGGALTAATAGTGRFWVYWLDATRFIAGAWDRWRVRRDQLRDRRADPGEVPRSGRHRGERHVLGRRLDRRDPHRRRRQPPLGRRPHGASRS